MPIRANIEHLGNDRVVSSQGVSAVCVSVPLIMNHGLILPDGLIMDIGILV